jgi:hypothetical protein
VIRMSLPLLLLLCAQSFGQTPQQKTVDRILFDADIACSNLLDALQQQKIEDPTFVVHSQLPEDPQPQPQPIFFKDGHMELNVTPAQHARSSMECIRQALYGLKFAKQSVGAMIGTPQALESWPELRDIACQDRPASRYYNLEGLEQFCPAKK